MKKRHPSQELSDDERIARYAYLLGHIPETVADRAYAAAFDRLSAADREGIVGELRSQIPAASEGAASDDPEAFARFMRDLHARHALVSISGAGILAAAFITSPPIVTYFTTGAGSVSIDEQPPWVHELAGHETAPIDGGQMHHFKGVNSGVWFA